MKKILSKIRDKSPEFRLMLSILCAIFVTVVILGGYILIEASSPSVPQTDVPSPIGSLVNSIKGTVATDSPSSTQTQVIDASQTSSPDGTTNSNDETNPFVNQSTQNQIQDQNSQTQTQ